MDYFIYQPLPRNVPPVFALHAECNRVFFSARAQPSLSEATADQKPRLACVQRLLRNSLRIYKGARLNTASVGALPAFERVFLWPAVYGAHLASAGTEMTTGTTSCPALHAFGPRPACSSMPRPSLNASHGFSSKVILSKLPCNVALHR